MHEAQREIPVNEEPADINSTTNEAQVGTGKTEVTNTPILAPRGLSEDTKKVLDKGTQADNHLSEKGQTEIGIQIEPSNDAQVPILQAMEIQTRELLAAPKSPWQELPVPDGPDKHEACFEKGTTAPHRLKLIGARVRGKSHKHAGTNCDDWFEFDFAQDWTLMAVADGVGSRKLSRVGAKEACRSAVKVLKEDLQQVILAERTSVTQFRNRGKDGRFPDMDMNQIEQALFRAMDAAYHSLVDAKDSRQDKQEYIDLLGQNPEISDFSTTLLLAVHNCFMLEDKDYDFIMSLQVGDGMIAAVNVDDKLTLLGKPDSGEFAGQVIPISNSRIRDDKEKRRRIFTKIQRMKAIMLMTDGVADDYFPNDPEMLRLYEDLLKESIITPTENGDQSAKKEGQQPISQQERLKKWLDSYYVKGSFDDRTLVVLFREDRV